MMRAQGSRRVKPRRRALVTGGGVRVGRAIALALARAGLDVAIGYHRSTREARRTLRELRACGARAVALRADLADPPAARRLVARAAQALGGLDVLVNNAAVFYRTPFAETTPAQFDELMSVNLRGPFFCAQAAAARMGRRGGRIVNVGDAGAASAWPGYIPYTLSKAGIVVLTRSLAVALRRRRIAVNCVAPGAVLAPAGFSGRRWQALTRCGAGSAEDVAAAVVFFATCSEFITGQIQQVDGGETG
ncbi:MAG: SDR family oxidoreductase [Candidatus Rokubacteria bacterium]|nr:SDR family oxidoreductase [Candidatus Rokubacteria bacterium]